MTKQQEKTSITHDVKEDTADTSLTGKTETDRLAAYFDRQDKIAEALQNAIETPMEKALQGIEKTNSLIEEAAAAAGFPQLEAAQAAAALDKYDGGISRIIEAAQAQTEELEKTFQSLNIFTELIQKSLGMEIEKAAAESKHLIYKQLKTELEMLHKEHPETTEITIDDLESFIINMESAADEEIEEEIAAAKNKEKTETDPCLKYYCYLIEAAISAKEKYKTETKTNPYLKYYHYIEAIEAAKEKYEAYKKELERLKSNLPTISTGKIAQLLYPLDKVNSSITELKIGEKTPLKAESDEDARKGITANIYALINMDDIEKLDGVTISRKLSNYDKRVFIAVANLKRQGHDIVTTAQIYRAMGGRGNPSGKDREKILKSLEFMSMGRVSIDNREEAKIYKYDRVNATFPLLATAIGKGYVNGLVIDDAINIIEAPRLFEFACNRRQIATVEATLLESPISMTESNIALEDYLLRRIFEKKSGKTTTQTILLETVYKKCNITTIKQKQRLPDKLERLLNHYKSEKWIKSFTITDRTIKIITNNK